LIEENATFIALKPSALHNGSISLLSNEYTTYPKRNKTIISATIDVTQRARST
jgi:hypothetical protein